MADDHRMNPDQMIVDWDLYEHSDEDCPWGVIRRCEACQNWGDRGYLNRIYPQYGTCSHIQLETKRDFFCAHWRAKDGE